MVKKYTTVKVEENIIKVLKSKYSGNSLNKVLMGMLIESGEYVPPEQDREQWNEYNHMIDCKLKSFMRKVEERFNIIETQLR